jgi:hypothetical protein
MRNFPNFSTVYIHFQSANQIARFSEHSSLYLLLHVNKHDRRTVRHSWRGRIEQDFTGKRLNKYQEKTFLWRNFPNFSTVYIQQNSKYYYNNDDKNHNKNKTDITEMFSPGIY